MRKLLCILISSVICISMAYIAPASENEPERVNPSSSSVNISGEFAESTVISIEDASHGNITISDIGNKGERKSPQVVSIKDSVLGIESADIEDSMLSDPEKAYKQHTAGSVILLESSSADITLDNCGTFPESEETKYLFRTVCSKNTTDHESAEFSDINVLIKNSCLKGNIAHEDFERILKITFSNSAFEGGINEYDYDHWVRCAEDEGFAEFVIPENKDTHYGAEVILCDSSVWTVTEECVLSLLDIENGSVVKGLIYIDGNEVDNIAAEYRGNILVVPGDEVTAVEAVTVEDGNEVLHVHSWILENEGSPADCELEGYENYICTECAALYTEIYPALGHDLQFSHTVLPGCQTDGRDIYICSRCGYEEEENLQSATGHNMQIVSETASTCTTAGQITYQCTNCHASEISYKPLLEHELEYAGYTQATCTSPSYYHYICKNCPYDVSDVGEDPAYGHDFSVLTPDYGEGLAATHHVFACYHCGEIDYASRTPHSELPCACGWN